MVLCVCAMANVTTKFMRVWRRRCTNRLLITVLLVMTPIIMLSTHFHSEIIEFDRGVGSLEGKTDYHGYIPADHTDRTNLTAVLNRSTPVVRSKKDDEPRPGKRSDIAVDTTREKQESGRRKPQIVSGLPVVYVGCYQDYREANKRTLQGTMWNDNKAMTVDACVKHCDRKGLSYVGLQYQVECWCSNSIQGAVMNETGCHMRCAGDPQQTCGGDLYLSVYHIEKEVPRIPEYVQSRNKKEDEPTPGVADGFKGCIKVPNTAKMFALGYSQTDASMSVVKCKSKCVQKAYSMSAVTDGNQCHCGHLETTFNYQNPANQSLCNVPCGGFEGHYCGGRGYASLYRTNVEDPRCQNASLKKDLPLVALASFPGSGNTWVRHIIERSSGIYTGSFYTDGELFKKGFKGEREHWRKRNTIVVKTHDFNKDLIKEYDAAILILRNPYKAMIAEHNRKFGGHTGYAAEDKYKKGTEWNDFVLGKSRTWTNTAMTWLQHCPKVLVVHFEHLQTNMNRELRRMMEFLNVPIEPDRLLCAEMDSEGKFKRPASKRKALTFDPFTHEMHEYVEIYIKTVALALKLYNHTPLPDEYAPDLGL